MAFGNAQVLSFESRRANEMAELIRINGGDPFVAPALVEVPIENNREAFAFADRLYNGDFEMMIFLTGVGARVLHQALATRDPANRFPATLRTLTTVVRGPKPAAVLREWNVPISVSVPEPNTWRELLTAVAGRPEKTVAVQEYGRKNQELLDGLTQQGRQILSVPVYQWQLPSDTTPLEEALRRLLGGDIKVALFTTAVQIDHLLGFSQQHGQKDSAIEALRKIFIASIGPTCSEALKEHGLYPVLEPSHPKMGVLVREAAIAYAAKGS